MNDGGLTLPYNGAPKEVNYKIGCTQSLGNPKRFIWALFYVPCKEGKLGKKFLMNNIFKSWFGVGTSKYLTNIFT